MSLVPISVGTNANDGTGDPLRTAFIKTNEGFIKVDSAIDFERVVSNTTVTEAYKNLDVFPDFNETSITLPDPSLLNVTSSRINVLNQTNREFVVIVKDHTGLEIKRINPTNSFSFFFNSTTPQTGIWESVHIQGNPIPELITGLYGDFNAISWSSVPTGEYIMTGTGSEFSNFSPKFSLLPASIYIWKINITNESGEYRIDTVFTTDSDFDNKSIGRPSGRAGADFGSSVTIGWKTVALLEDLPILGDLINTVVTNGNINISVTGNLDPLFTPPQGGQNIGAGTNVGDWYKVVGWQAGTSFGLTVDIANGEIVVPALGGGVYIGDGWANFSHSANNTSVAFLLGVRKQSDGLVYFSQRPTQNKLPNTNTPGIISGGGFSTLEEGDRLSVWVSCTNPDPSFNVHDANFRLHRLISE